MPPDLRTGNKKRIRAHARESYAQRRPLWTNPFTGNEALWWRAAYLQAQARCGQVYTMLPRTKRIPVRVRGRVATPKPMSRIAIVKVG